MNQVLIEEQRSFEEKMDGIEHTNDLLDDLERKMNSYFKSDGHFKSTLPAQSNSLPHPPSQPQPPAKPNSTFRLFPKAQGEKKASSPQPKASSGQFSGNSNLRAGPEEEGKGNPMIQQMERSELLLREQVLSKQRKIKQLEQEVMNENEERVYLYKVNIRLEEELKAITESLTSPAHCITEITQSNNRLKRLKKDLSWLANERKQLLREEQTLREGYLTVMNNRRDITNKELEQYSASRKEAEESYEVLGALARELQKLKCVVESRIKAGLTKRDGSRGNQSLKKRKVIKSFKA